MIYKPENVTARKKDALTISEEGAGALTQQLVLQGLETFTFHNDESER